MEDSLRLLINELKMLAGDPRAQEVIDWTIMKYKIDIAAEYSAKILILGFCMWLWLKHWGPLSKVFK